MNDTLYNIFNSNGILVSLVFECLIPDFFGTKLLLMLFIDTTDRKTTKRKELYRSSLKICLNIEFNITLLVRYKSIVDISRYKLSFD